MINEATVIKTGFDSAMRTCKPSQTRLSYVLSHAVLTFSAGAGIFLGTTLVCNAVNSMFSAGFIKDRRRR